MSVYTITLTAEEEAALQARARLVGPPAEELLRPSPRLQVPPGTPQERAARFLAWADEQRRTGGAVPDAPPVPLSAFDREALYADESDSGSGSDGDADGAVGDAPGGPS